MAKKKKYRKGYTTGGRVDMRNGGRVGYAEGDRVIDPETGRALPSTQDRTQQSVEPVEQITSTVQQPTQQPIALEQIPEQIQPTVQDFQNLPSREDIPLPPPPPVVTQPEFSADDLQFLQNIARKGLPRGSGRGGFLGDGIDRIIERYDELVRERGQEAVNIAMGRPDTTPSPSPTPAPLGPAQERFEEQRGERIIRTGEQAEAIARGEIPEGVIPTAEIAKVPTGPEFESEALQLAQRKGVTPEFVKEVGAEAVMTMKDIARAATPEEIQAARMEAARITEAPEVAVARGEVSDQALAEAAGVERVAPIEAAKVEVVPGALTERVIGTLSPEAKSQAAINAGSTLSRITRAKKQLANAGLSDADITELGNDPEALEARLADFSEEQRGIIEGLPEEALVSNQLDSLLSGIEEGEVPAWARPAVASVEQMLAQRGLSASTVGRDSLLNAIIQSAIPLAQSNAQAIQASVAQQRGIEAQEAEANAARRQQTALTNASQVFQMDMAQFSADQQTALSNSKFLQTVGLTEASNEQQSAIQNAVLMSQANLAEADFYQKAQIQNAQAFLQMDMQNLNNQQQANVLRAQQEQQRLLSNQAAENAARQFNATSENQTQQFMTSLNAQINQFNTAQMNASQQFNIQQQNAAEARRVANELEINKTNAAIINQTRQFNEQVDFQRQQFNLQNAQAIQQSNIEWRRKANLADTAALNAVNQQNAQNAFNLSSQAQAFLWQELRDQADYDFRWATDSANRKTQAMIAAASAEGDAAKNWSSNFNNVSSTIDRIFGTGD
jgi:hypothetical protein